MRKNLEIESLINSFRKKAEKLRQQALAFETVADVIKEETGKYESASSENNHDLDLNSKVEIESAINEFFHDHRKAATTVEIEKSLKSKGYVGYSKKGLIHSIGTILNRSSQYYCVNDNKYSHLKTYAPHSMEAILKKNGDSNKDVTIPDE